MKCVITIFGLNDLYSQEYADMHHNGEESEDNYKFEWEDELLITSNVSVVEEIKNSQYTLKGELNGQIFNEKVSNVRVLEITSEDSPNCQIVCSEAILNKIEIQSDKEEYRIKVFINDLEPFSNPIPGVYIATKEFPKNLIF